MSTVKESRVKVETQYTALGYRRGVNKRNVYLINGFYYAYHPQYEHIPSGELKGYVRCNKEGHFFIEVGKREIHKPAQKETESSESI